MPNRLSPSEAERIRKQEELVKTIREKILRFYQAGISIPEITKAINAGNEDFSVQGSKLIQKLFAKRLKTFNKQMEVLVVNAINENWQYAQDDHWHKLKTIFRKDLDILKQIDELRQRAEKYHVSRSKEARDYYLQKRNGLSLSDRVWNIGKQLPTELDVMVQNAIKEGKSAQDLAGELKQYLKEPERLFRRVRNPKTGKLEWSKAAKEYHPGQGVYRSSYKNAMRLARTEINIAYRYAEWQSYQNNFMIKGFEIRLSNSSNHCPVCERLAGIYPKWFLWTGWHPQCMCYMVPVQISRDDLLLRFKLRKEGRLNEWQPDYFEELPKQFVEYLDENSTRILGATSVPYWMEDNWERIKPLL